MKLKLLHVIPSYLPAVRYGGPMRSVHGLCRALAARGHTVDVLTTNVDGAGESGAPVGRPVDLDGVRVRYFRAAVRRLYYAPAMARALSEAVVEADVVHLHSVFLWPTLAAARRARRAGVPYVVSPRGMLVEDLIRRRGRLRKRAWLLLFERRTIEQAAAVHLTSALERRDLEAFPWRVADTWTIPNGIGGVDRAEPAAREPSRVLFLGRINWKKGLDRLIRALAHAPAARLVVAGNDEENLTPALRRLARELGVHERVAFVGVVEGEAKWELLRTAALLALPSYSENFGNVVLEAWSTGCPVLVTPEVGLAEDVQRHRAGAVCAGDPETLGTTLATLLANPAQLQAFGAAGQEAVAREYGWDAIAARMEAHYLRLAARS